MKKVLLLLALVLAAVLVTPLVRAENLTSVIVSAGSNPEGGGDIFATACDGNMYQLVVKEINACVSSAYLFIAANAPHLRGSLYTSSGHILSNVRLPVGAHPLNPALHYWEKERGYGKDSIWVETVWIRVQCFPSGAPNSIETYGIVYTKPHVPTKPGVCP